MSWIQRLNETYINCESLIGLGSEDHQVPLLPICHMFQNAQIEIVLDQSGNFKRARVVPKDEARTIIPCTESSGGRAGKRPINHPLCDKLQYIAGDFIRFGGEVTSGYAKNPIEPYEKYREMLHGWCESKFSHSKTEVVLGYINRGNVIEDLVNYQILFTDVDGNLLKKWDKKADKNTPEIFKVSPNASQMNAFVRWVVEIPGDPQAAVWTDLSLFKSWIGYYLSTRENRALCYVTGEEVFSADQHPRNIRRAGDRAKLISSNDISGFTFRGRFLTAEQACSVGFEVTQRAHGALSWLISRQGYRRGNQAIVAWSTAGHDIPDPLADPLSILGGDLLQSDVETSISTAQELSLKLKKKINGYRADLGNTDRIVVMGLDSATSGRMAISFYRELTASDFLKRIDQWHNSCCWIHDYGFKEIDTGKFGKKKKLRVRFVGAPAPSDIAEAAYGRRVDDKLRNVTVERILPCIIDGQPIPKDLVESAVRRASNRIGMEEWEWNKTLSIACALYRKYLEKETFSMALEEGRKTRDYLYGRLLALADSLEQWALKKAGEGRQTTAARLMQRFADHPYTTWRTIELALGPYKARLGNVSLKRQRLISEVMAMFDPDDFINDKKLSGEFLLGYHCQREALWSKGVVEEQVDDSKNE